MKKFFKSAFSVAIATAVCLSLSAPAFAEETKKVYTEIFDHISTLYEPEQRDTLEVNSLYRMLGNVSQNSSPNIVSVGNTIIMTYTDADEIVSLVNETTSEDGTMIATLTEENQVALYSTFDETKNVWNVPKYIYPSSTDWMVGAVALKSNGTDIYAVCLEHKATPVQPTETGFLNIKLPDTQIAIHRYDSDTNSFSPIKLFEANEESYSLMPNLVFADDTIIATWLSVPKMSIADFLLKETEITCCYSKYANDSWSETKCPTTMPYEIAQNGKNMTVSFASGTVNGKLAFAFYAGEGDKAYTIIKNENNNIIYNKEGVFNAVINGKNSTDRSGLYFVENDELYTVTGASADKTIIAKNLDNITALSISDTGDIFFTTRSKPNTVSVIEYDSDAKRYGNVASVRNTDSEILDITASSFNEGDVVILHTAGASNDTEGLSKTDVSSCGTNINYIIYMNQGNEPLPNNKTTTKTGTDNNSGETKVDYGKPVSESVSYEEAPSTGSRTELGAFAAFGLAMVATVILKKKKKVENA